MTALFAAGDRVTVRPDRANPNLRPGIYTIKMAMPRAGHGPRQYRVKHDQDPHERIVDEPQLNRLG